jgi:phenylpyruvate tautomerase PptA (4-oxalocrotonate tautomerase family)
MPICELLTPTGIEEDTKVELMKRLTAHIEEAYPHLSTHIFLREVDRGDVMFAGSYCGKAGKDARVCTLICPPTARAEAVRTMMENVNSDILTAYPPPADVFIIHRVDDLTHVMVNGSLGSENPKYKQPGPH